MDQLFLLQFPPMASSVHVVISSRFVCSRVMESYLYAGKKLKGGVVSNWSLSGKILPNSPTFLGKILTKKLFCCRASSVSQGNSSRPPAPPPIKRGQFRPCLYAKYWDINFIRRAAMLKQANMETRPLGQKCNKPGRRNRGAQWHIYLHTKCGGG